MSRQRLLSRRSLLRSTGFGTASALLTSAAPGKLFAQVVGEVDKSIAWARANLPASTPEIVTGAAKEGKLELLLLPSGTDDVMVKMIDKFNEHYPFIKVSYTLVAAVGLTSRLNGEMHAKTGITDHVMLPANMALVQTYVDSGALAQFVISQDAAFGEGAKLSGLWYAWEADCPVTIYRKGAVTEEEIKLLHTYKGAGDPRFKGRLGMNAVTSPVSTTGSYVLLSQPDDSIWKAIAANKPQVKSASAALMNGLLAGEYDVSLFGSFATSVAAALNGAPIEFGAPSLAPLLYAPGAISAYAPHPNAAKLWQDWIMSKDGENLWVEVTGTISGRDDSVLPWAKQQPWFFEDKATNKPLNWPDFTKRNAEVVTRFRADMTG